MIYNDFDKHACAWLRELISAGHLPEGTVDERSIADIRADDIRDARQFHTFAGIGGWPVALRLAGWPESVPVWSGSCPCQPFSAAGKRKGQDDERDLWPAFFRLIRDCRPGVIFGEQVASADVVGKVDGKPCPDGRAVWLDRVFADLEGAGYTCGAAVLGAHSVGAPHIRQRLYWVAYAEKSGTREDERGIWGVPGGRGEVVRVADTHGRHGGDRGVQRGGEHGQQSKDGGTGERVGHPHNEGSQGHGRFVRINGANGWEGPERHDSKAGFWTDCDWLPCRDGEARRVESGSFPLVDGLRRGLVRGGNQGIEINAKATAEARISRLRGYGNAIVPQVAAMFIRAFMESFNADEG